MEVGLPFEGNGTVGLLCIKTVVEELDEPLQEVEGKKEDEP